MIIPRRDDPLQLNQRQLKEFLITIGLRAWRAGDLVRVQCMTERLRGREGVHV
jgi:hypothetical protein